jgi:hypothetical protein
MPALPRWKTKITKKHFVARPHGSLAHNNRRAGVPLRGVQHADNDTAPRIVSPAGDCVPFASRYLQRYSKTVVGKAKNFSKDVRQR